MKKTFLPMFILFTAISGNAQSQSVFEAMSSAYNTNPSLQAQRAYLRSVDENVAIAKSGYRPTVYLGGSYTDSQVDSNVNPKNQDSTNTSVGAYLNQPLFNGFSTLNSVKSADSYVRSEQNNLYNVEQTLLLSASTSYFDVVRDKAIVDLQKNNEELLKKRLDETKERFNVGEVTRTDVSQSQARYSQAISDRIAAEGDLEASIADYVKVIGGRPDNLEEPKNINEFLPGNITDALDYAKVHNYSIRQAKELFNSKSYNVATNNGALLPSVSLNGQLSHNETSADMYEKDPETDNMQIGVNMNIPLYTAGETRAKIRQSKYQKWQAQEEVLNVERQAVADVTSSWEYMVANRSKIKAIKDQVAANEIALDGVQKEEALGNRTVLDVLDAYQELLNSNVEEVKARRNYYVASMSLLQSMGKLTAKDMNLNVDLYNAKQHYKNTRDKWLSLSIDK